MHITAFFFFFNYTHSDTLFLTFTPLPVIDGVSKFFTGRWEISGRREPYNESREHVGAGWSAALTCCYGLLGTHIHIFSTGHINVENNTVKHLHIRAKKKKTKRKQNHNPKEKLLVGNSLKNQVGHHS